MLRRALPLVIGLGLAACQPASVQSTPPPTETADPANASARVTIDGKRMLATIEHLADDALRGRYTLAPEIQLAAEFLAKQYQQLGLEAVADGIVVPYKLTVGAKLSAPARFVAMPARGRKVEFDTESFTPLPSSASAKVEADAFFVGYAVASDAAEDGSIAYDDLEGVDLEGKIAVVFTNAPNTPDFAELFAVFGRIGEDYKTAAAPFVEKRDDPQAKAELEKLHKKARERVATALGPFMRGESMPEDFWKVNDPFVAELDIFSLLGPVMRKSQEMPGPRFSSGGRLSTKLRRLEAAKAAGIVVIRGPRSYLEADAREAATLPELAPDPPEVMPDPLGIPVVQVRWQDAKGLFKAAGMRLEKTQKQLDTKLEPASRPMNLRLQIETAIDPIQVEVPNVLAKIPGTDLADEIILFGAHFDHIGAVGLGDCRRIERTNDDICNGADDNASGTAMVLELARVLSQSGIKPRRTLMFASFSGEEMGLLGSEAMAEAPPFDRDKVVAMVNLDMVGRLGMKGLAIGGLSSSAQWMPMLDEIGTKGMEVLYERSITSRSDHANWFAHEIPVLFFFTGVHSDYHRAGDHADEINVEGMQTIGELVYEVATKLADGMAIDYREPPEGEGLVGRLPGSDEATIEKKVEKGESPEPADAGGASKPAAAASAR